MLNFSRKGSVGLCRADLRLEDIDVYIREVKAGDLTRVQRIAKAWIGKQPDPDLAGNEVYLNRFFCSLNARWES